MILPAIFKKFRINEFVQFFVDVIGLCEKNNPETLNINVQLETLKETNARLDEAFKRDQKSGVTKQLTLLDQQRDEDIICLRMLADAFSHYFEEDKKNAGERILTCIDKYGSSIYRMNYHAETSTVDNLGKELKNTAELAEAINTLGIADVVDHMAGTNDQFKDLYQQRVQEEAANNDVSAGEIIKEALNNYHTLVTHIEAHATITPSDAYTKLINELNGLIERYNATMALRTGTKEDEEVPVDDVNEE